MDAENRLNHLKMLAQQKGYRLTKELGRGGFGVTYLAVKDGKEYVVKFGFRPGDLNVEYLMMEKVDAFCSNYYACLVDVIREGNEVVAIVSRYIEGLPLDSSKLGSLYLSQINTIAMQMLDALKTIHELGVAHRDVKPANIIYNPKNNITTLIDFGVATNKASKLAGSSPFLWGELFKNPFNVPLKMSMIGDVFGLGVTLYYIISKSYPFEIIPEEPNSIKVYNYSEFYPLATNSPMLDAKINNMILHPALQYDWAKW